ncbi:MAG: hypothetical protein IPK99_05690 [Flavobacteriales bacterium]|nr:hypothetical protein [Flavobacteriales bacterium]
MKKDEVPQDDANMLEGKFKVVKYALNEKGEFEKVPSVGWEPENVALSQAWDVINEKVEAARQQVLKGAASPLLFHMEKNMMDVVLLAKYMDLPTGKVKRHLEPDGFVQLDSILLAQYAEVLLITVEELKRVPA